jgi:hypothetical protein
MHIRLVKRSASGKHQPPKAPSEGGCRHGRQDANAGQAVMAEAEASGEEPHEDQRARGRTDALDGGIGTDTCLNGETIANCEA